MRLILTAAVVLSIATALPAGTLHEGYWPTLRHSNYDMTATINGVDTGAAMRFANGNTLRHTVDRDDLSTLDFTRDGTLWNGAEIEFIDDHEYRIISGFLGDQLIMEVRLDGILQRTEIDLPETWDEPIFSGELERFGVGDYMLHDVGGPWHNPGVVIYDRMVDGDHWQLTLDRFGFVTKDVLMIPEPSTWQALLIVIGGYFAWRLLGRHWFSIGRQ